MSDSGTAPVEAPQSPFSITYGGCILIKFAFLARCEEQTIPLEVSLVYKPGNQTQRARRVAVGELLAQLELEQATIDASGTDLVKVQTDAGTWIIGESYSSTGTRGPI